MNPEPSLRALEFRERLEAFMADHVYPAEAQLYREVAAQPRDHRQWTPLPTLEGLKQKAKAQGLWNLFLPHSPNGAGLSNLDYAPLAEITGRSHFAPEIFNCSAPDTGNMETLDRYGDETQKARWLKPLLAGEIRSAFAMTEPAVASSDATNIRTRIERDGGDYVVSGHKWWISGAGDPRCAIMIVMGQTDPDKAEKHLRQSMILIPTDAPGVEIVRPMPIFGDADAPHGHMEVAFRDVRVPASNLLLGEGRGFEIAQGRLGPGRIHHCMRMIGLSERALERLCRRLSQRTAFHKPIADQSVWRQRIAEMRCAIEQARLLTLKAAWMMDTVGNKAARAEIAMIKIVAARLADQVVDMTIQGFGGGGVADSVLTSAHAYARTLRLADGPDEVHCAQLARMELARHAAHDGSRTGGSGEVQVAGFDYPMEA